MTTEQMEKYAPEFVDQYESSPALALDIRIVTEEARTYRRTCIGYEDGHCSLYEGKGARQTKFSFLKISHFLERIRMEHIGMKNSSDFELQIYSLCSIEIRSRKREIFE